MRVPLASVAYCKSLIRSRRILARQLLIEELRGTTYTGEYEDVQAVDALLMQRGLGVPIHVDAASGGFVAPFLAPSCWKWDFRLKSVSEPKKPKKKHAFNRQLLLISTQVLTVSGRGQVASINVSGYKYGFVYPGIGWGLWRSRAHLPKNLVFQLSYLGATQDSYTLNFTRGSSHVVAQYCTSRKNISYIARWEQSCWLTL